jgi:hypothetical protein
VYVQALLRRLSADSSTCHHGVSIRFCLQYLAVTPCRLHTSKKGWTILVSAISWGNRQLPPRHTSFCGAARARYAARRTCIVSERVRPLGRTIFAGEYTTCLTFISLARVMRFSRSLWKERGQPLR